MELMGSFELANQFFLILLNNGIVFWLLVMDHSITSTNFIYNTFLSSFSLNLREQQSLSCLLQLIFQQFNYRLVIILQLLHLGNVGLKFSG